MHTNLRKEVLTALHISVCWWQLWQKYKILILRMLPVNIFHFSGRRVVHVLFLFQRHCRFWVDRLFPWECSVLHSSLYSDAICTHPYLPSCFPTAYSVLLFCRILKRNHPFQKSFRGGLSREYSDSAKC